MTIVLNGSSGITNDGGYTGDGVVFADTTPANTLVTTTGGGSDEVFVQNSQAVTTNYTIPATKNAMSTGPVSVDSGVTVTVSSGSRWVVI